MPALRKQFIDSLPAQGISAHTQDEYVRAVSRLAQFYKRSPELINDREILNVLKDLKKNQGLSDGTITLALCGLKAFYTKVLGRDWQGHWQTPAALKNRYFPPELRQRVLEACNSRGCPPVSSTPTRALCANWPITSVNPRLTALKRNSDNISCM